MTATSQAKVAKWKRELVDNLLKKFEEYPVIGVLDISGVPASQFQQMRALLRDRADIKVGRNELLRIVIEKASEEENELKELADYIKGQSALVFTRLNPFRLWKLLKENRTSAPAKPGMKAPEDIVVPAGETDFTPGPVLGELQRLGINARIQGESIVIVEDSKIVEEGDSISEMAASILSRFGIEPRDIGFELRAAYEDGTVFPGDMLVVDEDRVISQIQTAFRDSLNLSLEIRYPTQRTVGMMLGRASFGVQNLAINAFIFSPDTVSRFLRRANSEINALASIVSSEGFDAFGRDQKPMASASVDTKEEKEKT
ncbi:hypothetical protein AKJ45_01555 [candidate division MSBL1 archaeon SCGC-AAA261F19]|uniref:Large ribosomal subunit protein uL10 n=2 Tax=candidate division MSBL1 TaxID=215777 RepID=A0A133VAM9_9EURY|nr:hypothetical protein AKJ43_02145 [candidate division MSBL1 archaeon SCGC-AAA261D19]KXB03457.1 hypothetical protein AKJ45_01555 [candidate division MSBL1 archaeon SCGC-AAA261F19]